MIIEKRCIYPGRRSLSPGRPPALADTRCVILESYNLAELLVFCYFICKMEMINLTHQVLWMTE